MSLAQRMTPERRLKYLVIGTIVLSLPLFFQGLLDLFGLPKLIPLPALMIPSSLVEVGALVLLVHAPANLAAKRLSPAELSALSSLTAWFVSLYLWSTAGIEAGAAYSPIAAALIVIALAGRYFEVARAPESAEAEDEALPQARLQVAGKVGAPVPAANVKGGDLVLVGDGETVPVDGRITEGIAEFEGGSGSSDISVRNKGPGEEVYAGEKCFGGYVTVQAVRPGDESVLALSLKEDEQADDRRVAAGEGMIFYFAAGILVAAVMAVVGWTVLGRLPVGLEAALVMAIIAAPPVVPFTASIPRLLPGAFRQSNARLNSSLSRLPKPGDIGDIVIFPERLILRTEMRVAELRVNDDDRFDMLSCTREMAERVGHPLARAITFAAEQRSAPKRSLDQVRYIAGRGIEARHGDRVLLLGNPTLLSHHGVAYRLYDDEAMRLEARGYSVLWFAEAAPKSNVIGLMAFEGAIRHDANESLAALRGDGRTLHLVVAGAQSSLVDRLKALGVDQVQNLRRPADLQALSEELSAGGKRYILIGDNRRQRFLAADAWMYMAPHEAHSPTRRLADLELGKPDLAAAAPALAGLAEFQRLAAIIRGLGGALSLLLVMGAALGFGSPVFATLGLLAQLSASAAVSIAVKLRT